MKLFYNKPQEKLKRSLAKNSDKYWEQTSLPLGNGSIGMGIFGDIRTDRIVLNHKTLWDGGPSPKRPDYCGGNITKPDEFGKMPYDYYQEIYECFKNGDNKKAGKLCDKLVGIWDGYGGYRAWGSFDFNYGDIKKVRNYRRELNMSDAVCSVEYEGEDKSHISFRDKRVAFVSYPDNCGVIFMKRENKDLSFELSLSSAHGTVSYTGITIVHQGELEDNSLKFCLVASIITDGKSLVTEKGISVFAASECIIVFSAGTDYLNNYPEYRTGETSAALCERVSQTVLKATEKKYEQLLSDHKNDFQELFNRFSLNLYGASDITADMLLRRYSRRESFRKNAIELLHAFGRYLLISSSRSTDMLPSNLQGIWNVSNTPPWSCDFHTNINLQMNYWPVFNSNLAECSLPLIRYIKSMVVPGRLTAKYYTNIESKEGEQNGFLFHTQCTPFGWTCPGWTFDWGWSPASVPWMLHNCFEYYEYTCDKDFLKNEIYPMLKESAEFFSKLLVEYNGRLLTCPCFSPEHGPRTIGNTYEQALIWQLFDDAAKSAKNLCIDSDLIEKWEDIKTRLKVYEIGDQGQIKEWYHETKLGEFNQFRHRHMSHLLGLFPCNVINKADNPELINAAVISMNHRTDKSTGWSMAQKINTWARVGDGDRALKLIGDLFKNGIYSNFFDYHPPFQIDGNFGFTSGVNEMLMQSNCGFIELLPALPSEWDKGEVKGLIARGNFEIDIEWENSVIKSAKITSNAGEKCRLCYTKANYEINGITSNNGFVEFDTKKGESYFLKLS